MKKIIANLEEPAPSIEFVGTVTSMELYRLAESLKQMAVALETLTVKEAITKPSTPLATTNLLTPTVPTIKPALPEVNGVKPAKQTLAILDKNTIEKFLTRRNVKSWEEKTKSYSPEKQQNLDELANFLGKNFRESKIFYQWLKRQLSYPGIIVEFTWNEMDNKQLQKVFKLCNLLKNTELVEFFTIKTTPTPVIQLKLASTGINYLTGHWLERFIKLEVDQIIKKYGGKNYDPKSNLLLTFQNDERAELDLFFSVGHQVFCIETKTNPSEKDLKEYIEKIKPLKMNNQNLLIVTAEKTPEECLKLTNSVDSVEVVGLNNFEEALNSMIKAAL